MPLILCYIIIKKRKKSPSPSIGSHTYLSWASSNLFYKFSMTPSILFVPPKLIFYWKPYIFHILHSYPKPKMAKIIATLFMLSLVLCSATLTYAARPDPKSNVDETTSQHEVGPVCLHVSHILSLLINRICIGFYEFWFMGALYFFLIGCGGT